MRCRPDANGNGTCVSVCEGVVCPGGADCDKLTAQCGTPKPGWKPGTGSGGGSSIFGTGASSGSGDGAGGDGDIPVTAPGKGGCGCRTAGGPRGAFAGWLLFGLGLGRWRRRRAA
jgi:MYXO-CTERM domain-containing protein